MWEKLGAAAVPDDDFPEAWPEAFRELRALESNLRCPICGDFIATCLSVDACRHSCTPNASSWSQGARGQALGDPSRSFALEAPQGTDGRDGNLGENFCGASSTPAGVGPRARTAKGFGVVDLRVVLPPASARAF